MEASDRKEASHFYLACSRIGLEAIFFVSTQGEAELFDSYSSRYKESVQSAIGFSGLDVDLFTRSKSSLLLRLSSKLGLSSGSRILNIGCGTGMLDGILSQEGFEVTGIDISAESIDVARRNNPQCRYFQYDGSSLPFDCESFDFVLAVNVYHHVLPDERFALTSEAHRVLRREASFAVIEHNPFNLLTQIVVARCEFDRDAHLLTRSMCKKLLAVSSFREVRGEYFMVLPSSGILARKIESSVSSLPIGCQHISWGFK